MKKTIQARLFLVGCPRSGTTLLQSMLAAHSAIASFPESHFLLIASRSRRARWMRKIGLVAPEMRQHLRQFLHEVGHPELLPPMTYRLQPFIRQFAHILDQLTVVQGKSIWLEKTPGHLYYINDFANAIPNARFIHLIRNGADVVASLYEVTNQYPAQWGHGYTIEQCVKMWNRTVRLSMGYVGNTNHHIVRYEQLLAQPEAVLGDLCRFIGVPFETTMRVAHHNVAPQLIAPYESWKSNALAPLHMAEQGKFTCLFTPEQQRAIAAQLVSFTPENRCDSCGKVSEDTPL
ncbi:MAG: sulfotransferase [Caldilineaceae bacterium]|nr:sulfotransferase [Caldilineaceae bacterium]